LLINRENNLLSNNIFDNNNINNNLLNNNLSYNFEKDPCIYYLFLNRYLFLKLQNLNSINSIGNLFISNLLNELQSFNNNISLINNNIPLTFINLYFL